ACSSSATATRPPTGARWPISPDWRPAPAKPECPSCPRRPAPESRSPACKHGGRSWKRQACRRARFIPSWTRPWPGWNNPIMKPLQNPDPAAALRLAVVGHTNTGKTSLLRTLTRDPRFGQVQDSPGTTRHVEGARLLLAGGQAVELYDTPGMEDGMGLLDYLDQLSPPAQRQEGPDRILAFLDYTESA